MNQFTEGNLKILIFFFYIYLLTQNSLTKKNIFPNFPKTASTIIISLSLQIACLGGVP